jgi:hypothetical protein
MLAHWIDACGNESAGRHRKNDPAAAHGRANSPPRQPIIPVPYGNGLLGLLSKSHLRSQRHKGHEEGIFQQKASTGKRRRGRQCPRQYYRRRSQQYAAGKDAELVQRAGANLFFLAAATSQQEQLTKTRVDRVALNWASSRGARISRSGSRRLSYPALIDREIRERGVKKRRGDPSTPRMRNEVTDNLLGFDRGAFLEIPVHRRCHG